jgi:RsiW-degrading membrane proteinase PrsW (M82 family)
LQKLQQALNDAVANFEKLGERVSTLEEDNASIKEENISLKKENDNLKLDKWKRPRYIWCIILMMLCIIVFIMYFVWPDCEYNYPSKLIDFINNLDETKKGMASFVLSIIHGGLMLMSVNATFNLVLMKSEDEKKHWLIRLAKDLCHK